MKLQFTEKDIADYRRTALQAARRTRLGMDDAEDIAQESVIQLFRNRDTLCSARAVNSWLVTTATRLAYRRIASNARFAPLYELADERCTEDSMAAKLDRERKRDMIRDKVAELPGHQGEVLSAIYFDELPYLEVSKRMGLAMGSVGPARGRALKQLVSACRGDYVLVA